MDRTRFIVALLIVSILLIGLASATLADEKYSSDRAFKAMSVEYDDNEHDYDHVFKAKPRGKEVVPPVDPEVFHPCHQHLIMKHGIHLHVGMTFEGLVEREAWVFVYVFAPLPIVGATGSPGNPIAIL